MIIVLENIDLIRYAAAAKKSLLSTDDNKKNAILNDTADALLRSKDTVLKANSEDLERMDKSNPKYDRLKLTPERIEGIANEMRHVATLPSPLGKILFETERPNGMTIRKISVPFGVIGVVYEARPNVTFDVFSLCLKSGNVCILKGGSEAVGTNIALVSIIHDVLKKHAVNPDICTFLTSRLDATNELLKAVDYVDLVIPRGSSSLINYVRENARIPVIETGTGVCHTYFDKDGDREKGSLIIHNAKTRRVSVCNALECLLIHRARIHDLPYLCSKLADNQVFIFADEASMEALSGHYPAALLSPSSSDSYGIEFLDYKMSIKTVDSIEDALKHIDRYGSKHSDCIVSESEKAVEIFLQAVDSACVYANVSTAFTDGAQFGFGAEIGISTQKMHARGPMALQELTTYKYLITGNGQLRGE